MMAHHDPVSEDVKTKLHDLGSDAADTARANIKHTAATMRDRAVDEVENVANAADAAGDEFGIGSIQAQIADQVALQAERFAQSISQMDVNAISRDVSDFARRNPLVFVGGAALLGLAAARFLKARDPQPSVLSYGDDDPWATRRPNRTGGHNVSS